MTDPAQDDVFEAYLKRRPVLPALNDGLEPPAALDQTVLNRAREAIRPEMAGKPAPQRPPRWAVPMALAATLLLCLSVVLNISLNTSRPGVTAPREEGKTSALANATAEYNAAVGASASTRDALAANDGERRESVSGGIPSRGGTLPRAKLVGTPAPQAPAVSEVAQPASGAAPVAPAEATALGEAAKAAGTPRPADPKVWLQRIDALRAAGKTEQADAQMRRFKAAFPNYRAPAAAPGTPK